ncbi:MAG TPA: DNA polymerase III subunit delta [Beijerinckiaceae bacterium]|nr:DNA polymerase III subunit delta [Beijerinckiaceae bacterium]
MAVIRSADLPRFLASGWKGYRMFLVHGSDEGLVRETTAQLLSSAGGAQPDPLNMVVLEGDQIAQDPARLADELGTFGMFGGTRVIHVRNAGRVPPAVATTVFADPVENTVLALEAGELRTGSPLRTLAEKAPGVAAIACYADTTQAIQRLIADTLQAHGLTIAADARDLLAQALGSDRALSRGEIEKLALFASGEKTVTAAMVTAIVSDAGKHEVSALIDRAFAGQIREIEAQAHRFFAAGTNPAAIFTQAIGHVLLLRRALRNGNAELVAKQARLHFSREPAFHRAAGLWTESRLERALRLLSDAVLQSRKSARMAETLTVRTLWAISRLAGGDGG